MARRYFAARSFGYGPPGTPGSQLDPGMLVELGGFPNDYRLVGLGLLREVDSHVTAAQCGVCGSSFITDAHLNRHGRLRHPERALDAARLEDALEAADKQAEAALPLYMDQTAASRGVKRPRGRPRKEAMA